MGRQRAQQRLGKSPSAKPPLLGLPAGYRELAVPQPRLRTSDQQAVARHFHTSFPVRLLHLLLLGLEGLVVTPPFSLVFTPPPPG